MLLACGFFYGWVLEGGKSMNWRNRRRLMTLFAVLACVAIGGKIFKAYYRGDTMQSRVRPLN